MSDNILIVEINEKRSSLISKIEYDEDEKLLSVYFRKYYRPSSTHAGVFKNHFEEFAKQPSIGKYYLNYIKPNFTQIQNNKTMADKKRPKTKNLASNSKRYLKISIDVRKINKEWLFEGKDTSTYLNVTLHMLPDGTLDKYGNLGMITQDVPKEIYEAAEKEQKGMGKEIKGNILGNAAELDWSEYSGAQPGVENGIVGHYSDEAVDDLPF